MKATFWHDTNHKSTAPMQALNIAEFPGPMYCAVFQVFLNAALSYSYL